MHLYIRDAFVLLVNALRDSDREQSVTPNCKEKYNIRFVRAIVHRYFLIVSIVKYDCKGELVDRLHLLHPLLF